MSVKPGADTPRRDPEDLQREADAIRADLDRTLHELERKLSPRRLLDQSLSYVRENDLLQKVGTTVTQHPVPFLAASAGLLWVALARRQSRKRRWYEGPSASPRSGDFDRATQSFRGGASRARRAAERFTEQAGDTLDRTRDRTVGLGRQLNDAIREQPLVCGAIALAIGAIVGAVLPATQIERDLVARARNADDSLLDELPDEVPPNGPPPTSH